MKTIPPWCGARGGESPRPDVPCTPDDRAAV
jgi:hypothetical protein